MQKGEGRGGGVSGNGVNRSGGDTSIGGICTKTGDDGTTGIIGGKRLPKDHPLVECLGAIDELNAFLGDAKTALSGAGANDGATDSAAAQPTAAIIAAIQKELFSLSGILAGSAAQVPAEFRLNALVAELEANQSPIGSFVIPGANPASAKLHVARAVCRRVERRLISLSRLDIIPASEHRRIQAWFNRLSDVLFLLAQREAALC